MRSWQVLPLLLVVAASCTDLKQTEVPPGSEDASTPGDDAAVVDPTDGATPVDAGSDSVADAGDAGGGGVDSPPDVACALATDGWNRATKANAACADRRVFRLDGWTTSDSPLFAKAVSIAVAKNGRVGLAVNGFSGTEEGNLFVRTFVPSNAAFTSVLVKGNPGPFENVGDAVRIAAGNDDTFHLIYQKNLSENGGPVIYRRLPASNTFGPENQLVSVGHGTHLGIAVSPTTSDIALSYYTPPETVGVSGRIESVIRPDATQTFGSPALVQGSFSRDGARGNGQHVLAYDAAGAVRIAYNISQGFSSSSPKFAELAGNSWRQPKTIDNIGLGGLAGYSVGLVMVGQTKYVSYHYRKEGTTTAELRIANWVGESSTPSYDVRDLGIRATDPTQPQYSSALAVDGYGLLHLVYVRPTSDTRCNIGYMRQTRKGGVVGWLDDGVASDLICEDEGGVVVSLAVDGKGRPHIGYAVQATGVFYASRFDR